MDLLTEGLSDSSNGCAPGTQSKQAGCFARWCRFLDAVGIDNHFLDDWTIINKICLLCAFARSVRRNMFGKRKKIQLAGCTVSSTIANLCSAFRENFRSDPAVDENNNVCLILKRQLKKYIAEDPETIHQMSLPIIVFLKIWRAQHSPRSKALAQLIVGALFYGMRSCEYSTVSGARMTKKLTIREIRFFQQRREIPKTHANLNILKFSSLVSITFIIQKNGTKYATITQHASGKEICPVKAWAAITSRILSKKSANLDTEVDTYFDENGNKENITAKEVATHIKSFVTTIGKSILGFSANRVGTHSIRTSFAMFLYLRNVHPSTIMLQGRWSSDAFLLYVRPQVQQFSTGLSSKMVQGNFFTIPEVTAGQGQIEQLEASRLSRRHQSQFSRFESGN